MSVDSLISDVSGENCFPDVNAETVLLFQDINVYGAEDARTCWDNGSLINHDYAKRNNFYSQPITFRLDVAANGKGIPQEGVQ